MFRCVAPATSAEAVLSTKEPLKPAPIALITIFRPNSLRFIVILPAWAQALVGVKDRQLRAYAKVIVEGKPILCGTSRGVNPLHRSFCTVPRIRIRLATTSTVVRF